MQTKSRSTKTRKLRSLWFDSFWDWLGEQFSVAPLWVMLMNSGTHGSLVCWDLLTSTSSHRFSRLVLGFCQWIPAIDRSLWCVRKKKNGMRKLDFPECLTGGEKKSTPFRKHLTDLETRSHFCSVIYLLWCFTHTRPLKQRIWHRIVL